jgi:hypothetical protein
MGLRLEAPSGFALSVDALGSYGNWFVGGFASDKATTLGAVGTLEIPFAQSGSRRFAFRTSLGARTTRAADLADDPRSVVLTTDIGLRATVHTSLSSSRDLELYLGVLAPVAIAISPATDLEELAQVGEVGADYWLTKRVALSLQLRGGGSYGYDGDGAKAIGQANVGVRVALDDHHRVRDDVPEKKDGLGLFVATEWRAYGLASHLSHGPAFAAGASFFDRHLKVGLLATTRPGPINAETFPTSPLQAGQTYKGRASLPLRSDGGFIGLLVAPSFDIPSVESINVELPIAIGQSAYGFYLHGDDRKTPDGRRVSAWENDLFGGKDSSPAIGIDAGVKVGLRIPGARWLKPYVAGRYSLNLGYDTLVTNNYNGPSAAIGLEIER